MNFLEVDTNKNKVLILTTKMKMKQTSRKLLVGANRLLASCEVVPRRERG